MLDTWGSLVSFTTSLGLPHFDNRSSPYDRFCVGWSKMHDAFHFWEKNALILDLLLLFLELAFLEIAIKLDPYKVTLKSS